ncbi:MAG: type VI secretion system accessory protein TagJ [Pyrinomonadaceae bacterium]
MNEAKTQLDAGNLNGAMETALNVVKKNPNDAKARTFLFELACFAGNWERAEKQLDVIGHQDNVAMIGALIFRQNIKAERDRLKLFSDSQKPEFLMPPPDYVIGLLMANNRLREGNFEEARKLLDTVEEERPAFACKVNGAEVEDFRDYNDLTSCIFEVIVKDTYIWLPMEHVERIEFIAPKSLRDLFWLQAKVETVNGTNGEMFFPALYANSFKSDNDQVRLGRMTDWRDVGSEIYIGEGMRMFWFNGQDKPLLELNEIEFIHQEENQSENQIESEE